MPTLKEQILHLLTERDGLTDRQIAEALRGAHAPPQPIHQACRQLEKSGNLARMKRADGLFGKGVFPSLKYPLPLVVGLCRDTIPQMVKTDNLKYEELTAQLLI